MASRRITQKNDDYGVIQRGCSLTIPVQVKDNYDKPIDLTGCKGVFTVKAVKTDFDRHDDFAYIAKDIEIQDPLKGKFYIILSSDDTDFEPGQFYFDIELIRTADGAVMRLCTLTFTLDGGPSNRHVNKEFGQMAVGDNISVITLAEGAPIVVIAPTIVLNNDIFSQLATLMGVIEAQKSTVEELEDTLVSLEKRAQELEDKIAEMGG